MTQPMSDTRLIERWLPITEIGIESLRERTPMTPFPAPNRLHVWWARRPLVASRAAILASLLPADADHEKFTHLLGIHGDAKAAKQRIAKADRHGERLGANAYGYRRAFTHVPDEEDQKWLQGFGERLKGKVLDPTAGGGSIPFEAVRLGLPTYANDLNPVAALIECATVKWPVELGNSVKVEFEKLGSLFRSEVRNRLAGIFPAEPDDDCKPDGYLWVRTIRCPYCEGLVPLSPNWRLALDGTGVCLRPRCQKETARRICDFEIVRRLADQSAGTVAAGDATCPFPDCGQVIDGDEVKRQAQTGKMGEQLYTVVFKRRIITKTKAGKDKLKWERDFRAPRPEDDNGATIAEALALKMPEWEAMDVVPSERFPEAANDDRPIQYGMPLWRDMFSTRQLFVIGTCVEVFVGLLEIQKQHKPLSDSEKAAFVYLGLVIDKIADYNALLSYWDVNVQRSRHVFGRHDFSFTWAYAELAFLTPDLAWIGPHRQSSIASRN